MDEKTMKIMQQEVDEYIKQFKTGYFSPLGELAREVNHYYGEKKKKNSEKPKTVEEELGDVLFVTIIMANSLGIDLTEAFNQNMDKFNQRDHFRFERIDGEIEGEHQ